MIYVKKSVYQVLQRNQIWMLSLLWRHSGRVASQITSLTIVYSAVYSDADQRKYQSSASLAFVWGPVNSPHKWLVTRKMFPFDDVIMPAWKMVSGMTKKAKISNRVNKRIFNELWCWFSEASNVFAQWICIPNMKSIKGIFFLHLSRKQCPLNERI